MTAKEHFIQEWGTGFKDATLSSEKGLLKMSMEDIYNTMESYHQKEMQRKLREEYKKFIQEINQQ